ncbi:hypothetical protein EB118_12375 [bacterium]|nr:hypothetical protein [bacterium]
MNATAILDKFSIPTNLTVHHAIARAGDVIDNTSYPIMMANDIIKSLGGTESENLVEARLLAKALVEQAYYAKDMFDTLNVMKAIEKVKQVSTKMPFIYQTSEAVEQASKPKTITTKDNVVRASKSNNDKKAKALEIFKTLDPAMSASEKAKVIAKQLEITYANAYYYISRVFK